MGGKGSGGSRVGAGRPSSERKIGKSLYFSKSEIEKIEKYCDDKGLIFSVWVRTLIFREIEKVQKENT